MSYMSCKEEITQGGQEDPNGESVETGRANNQVSWMEER